MRFYREVTEAEARGMREWARKNYRPFTPIYGHWHYIVQEECVKMNIERGTQDATSR